MSDCLVTTLRWAWDNPNAELLGLIKMVVTNTPATLRFTADETLKLLSATWKSNNENTKSFAGNTDLTNFNYNQITYDDTSTNSSVILIPKYTCVTVVNLLPFNGSLDLDCFNYAGDNQNLTLSVSTTDGTLNGDVIRNLKSDVLGRMVRFRVPGFDFEEPLDVSSLGNSGTITDFSMYLCNSANIYGSLDNLGKSPVSTFISPRTKNVSIDIATFVQNNRNAGRTTGTINLREIGYCTVLISGVVEDVLPNWDTPLSWTASTITFNGKTINA